MSRKLVLMIVFLGLIVAAMFFLASMDVEVKERPVEKPVIGEELN